MLEDVRDVRSFPESLDKSARLLARAAMLGQRWDGVGETLVETVTSADLTCSRLP